MVLKAGLADQDYRKKKEMKPIFKYGTMGPSGLNQDSRDSLSFFGILARRRALFYVTRAGVCNQARELILSNFLTVFSLVP